MIAKDSIKKIRRRLVRFFYAGFRFFILRLPFKAGRRLGRSLFILGYLLTGKHRRVALETIDRALGVDVSAEEKKEILMGCLRSVGEMMFELLYFEKDPDFYNEYASIEGKEHLDAALAKGRGVIGLTAHFGNFPLMFLCCAHRQIKSNIVMRMPRDEKLERYFEAVKKREGLDTIYSTAKKSSGIRMIKALRNNELVFIVPDQNFGSSGRVFVDFFGEKAATTTGPVVLSQRTGAVMLPMFIYRQPDGRQVIKIDPPLELEEGDDDETVVRNTQLMTKLIEDKIRATPGQWGWMHRRWKSQPTEAERVKYGVRSER